MRLPRGLVPALVVGASFLFCAALVEVALRIAGFDPLADIQKGRELVLRASANPEIRYELTPGARGRAWHSDVAVNSHGMRDREYTTARNGAPRVLMAGDSVTFGSGVAVGERFSDILEASLSKKRGTPVEVLNFGVGGYDTLQEVATVEQRGLAFDPDLIVLAYCVNDVGDNSPNLQYLESLERLDSPIYRLRVVQLVRRALDQLRLMQRLNLENEDAAYARRYRDTIVPLGDDPELTRLRAELGRAAETRDDFMLDWYLSDAHLGRLAYSLDRLAALSADRNVPVLIAILPYLADDPAYEKVYELVELLATRRGLAVFQLTDALEVSALEARRREPRDPIHPDAEGHRLIAEALVEPVSGLLAPRTRLGTGSR